ncbi:hypothetical protein [Paenibacillus senegalimassiliensis]|nr:hypothetical protein [Paenibacillus senegalimassiliensis]
MNEPGFIVMPIDGDMVKIFIFDRIFRRDGIILARQQETERVFILK